MDNVDWMEEFDAFENPTNASKGAGKGGGPKRRNASQIEELEQEMKLLHWHKLANEAALKAALIRTKKLKESSNNPLAAVESRRERAQWMQQIIEEEQNKPLEVNEDFILKYEKQEREEEERLEEEVQRHIKSLQRIKSNLKQKEKVRRRTIIYREKRKALQNSLGQYDQANIDPQGPPRGMLAPGNINPESEESMMGGMHGTLSKVINSLDKLVDLEKRITQLESDVGPHSPVAGASGDHGTRRTRIKFTKRRAESEGKVPARNIFSVKEVPIGSKKRSTKRKGSTGRGRSSNNNSRNRNSSTFLTQSGGSTSNRRSRNGNNDRDPVVGNWLEKQSSDTRTRRHGERARGDPTLSKAGGRRRGQKEEAPPMQKFSDIRRQYEDRKDRFRKELKSDSYKPSSKRSTSKRRGGGKNSRSKVAARNSANRRNKAWGNEGGGGLSISGSSGKFPKV